MSLVDEIAVKIGADPTALKAALADSDASIKGFGQSADQTVGDFATKFGDHFTSMRHISTALATALGLNFETIAHDALTGMTTVLTSMGLLGEAYSESNRKGYEEADKYQDIISANMTKYQELRMSAEMKYQLEVQREASLQQQIQDMIAAGVTTGEQTLALRKLQAEQSTLMVAIEEQDLATAKAKQAVATPSPDR